MPRVVRTSVVQHTPASVSLRLDASGLDRASLHPVDPFGAASVENDFSATLEPGKPILPCISRFLIVPPSGSLELVIDPGQLERVPGEPSPNINRIDGPNPLAPLDPASIYPPTLAEMSEPFVIRGVRFVKLTLYPVQYDPVSGDYLLHRSVDATVQPVAGEPQDPANPPRRIQSIAFRKYLASFAANGADFLRDDPDYDDPPAYQGHYCVVSIAPCLPYIIPWIEWRRQAGYKVDIIEVPNDQLPSQIKRRVQELYDSYLDSGEEPFEYLLLVGDYERYSYLPNAGWVLPTFTGQTNWGETNHGDYIYACLEGGENDDHPDVAWGRWPAGAQETLELVVGRTLAYEQRPDLNDPAWFTRGSVFSQNWGNGNGTGWHRSIPTTVRWGREVLERAGYDSVIYYENHNWDQRGTSIGPFIVDMMNRGSNLLLGRAQNYYFRNGDHNFEHEVNDNTVFPIYVSLSGHGQWPATIMYRRGSGNHLKGFVSSVFCWSTPMTLAENAIWLDLVKGLVVERQPMGWAYNYALNHFEKYFNTNIDWQGTPIFPQARTDHGHFGDPALEPWFSVPRTVAFDYPQSIPAETKVVEVFVHSSEDRDPLPGVEVSFYAPGNIPLNNPDDYAQYQGYILKSYTTGADGIARFTLPEGCSLTLGTSLFVTVTGSDIYPHTAEIRIEQQQPANICLDGWSLREVSGNGDDFINPGEEYALTLTALNTGEQDADSVIGEIWSPSPFVRFAVADSCLFGLIQAGESLRSNGLIRFQVQPTCPDGAARPATRPVINVRFHSFERTWEAAITLDVHSPRLEFSGIIGRGVVSDSLTELRVRVFNRGRIASDDPTHVRLIPGQGGGITIISDMSSLPGIAVGVVDSIRDHPFVVASTQIIAPGSQCQLGLVMRSQSGFVDTTWFSVQAGVPHRGSPIGPDPYGYVAYDDLDTGWAVAPHYRWIEINPDLQQSDYDGVRLEREGDDPDNLGWSGVVALGFQTGFYGHLIDTISVCTNGFIAMGNQPDLINYQCWPLDDAVGGAVGMVAPFWTNLLLLRNSGIYTFHDADSGRFIVEWYRMGAADGTELDQTFELVLYDRDRWPSEQGDQNILFQYRNVVLRGFIREGDIQEVNATPYPSVGISSPDANSGLSYTYRNRYSPSAAVIANGRAITFTRSIVFHPGGLYGRVLDAATGRPIEAALVSTQHGLFAVTDHRGIWEIPRALAATPFTLTFHATGYNDSTKTDLFIPEGDSLEVNVALLHAELLFSLDRIDLPAPRDHQFRVPFTLTNRGNGPLMWRSEEHLLGEYDVADWTHRGRFGVGDSAAVERMEGVAFANERFYVAGSRGVMTNRIYVFDRAGALVDSFRQAGGAPRGFKDLEWDGELLWGAGEDTVRGFRTNGEAVARFTCPPLNPVVNIAYEPERDVLWLSGSTSFLYARDQQGNVLQSLNNNGIRISGLAYWSDDPDGYQLYIVSSVGAGFTKFYKMNTTTNDTLLVHTILDTVVSGGYSGLFIGDDYDRYSTQLFSVKTNTAAGGRELVDTYQLERNLGWLHLAPESGFVRSREVSGLTLQIDATGLIHGLYEGELRIFSNAGDGRVNLPVAIDVQDVGNQNPPSLLLPADGDTVIAEPILSDTLMVPPLQFVWSKSVDPALPDSGLSYRWHFTSGDDTAQVVETRDTTLTVVIDTLDLPLEWDRRLSWWVESVSDGIPVRSEQVFHLRLQPNATPAESNQPVSFGFKSIYPSPFNNSTTITFGIDRRERTTIVAYDITGRVAVRIFDGVPTIGNHRILWNAEVAAGGVYMIRLESGGRVQTVKAVVVR